ncbi:hypothetical protein COV14_02425 [Candidatus Woesearchaeota archaeon CG10_big_fil_rev_8_21_14_0_10_33_12]|nr:MAG: hypothetical protein COV14_02425 [Candidatus Woesearchaeota archaeon CG10_big_fil_rev_8_21_14_0_10_33_12]
MTKASPMDIRKELTIELLKKKGIWMVNKPTSAGVTTSVLRYAKEFGKKVVFIEPYHKIIEKQIEKCRKKSIKINSFRKNREMCPRVKKRCKDEPWRNAVMKCQYLPNDCLKKCMKKKETNCLYKELITKEYDILGLTYSKYEFINEQIKEKIKNYDVFLFDEITSLLNSSVKPLVYKENDINHFTKKFKASFKEFLDRGEKYKDEKEKDLLEAMWAELLFLCGYIDYSVRKALENPMKINKFGVRKVIGIINLREKISEAYRNWINNKGKYREILERYAKIEKFPIKYLDKLLDLYFEDYLLIEREKGNISIKSLMVDYDAFETFFSFFNPNKQLLILSDSSMPSILNVLLCNEKHKVYNWGDPLNTNKTQFIITDTINWQSKKQFFHSKDKDNIIKEISRTGKAISKNVRYFIITPDSVHPTKGTKYNYANYLEWHGMKEILNKKAVLIDHHRSTRSKGIKFEEKSIIEYHMSRPLIPENSYNHLCFVTPESHIFNLYKDFLIKFSDSLYYIPILCKRYKRDNEASAYINRIGRIKDEKGIIKAVSREPRSEDIIHKTFIVNIGFKRQKTKELLSNTFERPAIITPFKEGRLFKDLITITNIIRRTSINYWEDMSTIEEEVPLLAYIINECKKMRKGKRLRSKSVIKDKKEYSPTKLKKIVLKHKDLLSMFKISINETNRGISFKRLLT